MKITKKTYDKNVKKFAAASNSNFKMLDSFVKKLKLTSKQVDSLTSLIDAYSALNIGIIEYAHKNSLDLRDFTFDISYCM